MDTNGETNPKKRGAPGPPEDLPFSKRSKYTELFPSVFTSVRTVFDICTSLLPPRYSPRLNSPEIAPKPLHFLFHAPH